MARIFDVVLASSDLSLDRVLNARLPAALVFYDRELPGDLRRRMDDLAREYAGKILIVTLALGDAAQAAARFNVRQFPALVTVRGGAAVTRQENVLAIDLKPHFAHLVGEGPLPVPRAPAADPGLKRKHGKNRNTSPGPLSVTEANFEREVLKSDRPVLIDFWAAWCGPCRMVEPTVEALAREQRALKVVKVNVDENPGLASRYGVMSIPAMIVIRGGQEVDRWVGALPENAIRSRVRRWIHSQPQTA